MKKFIGSLALAGLISASSFAGTITVAHSDLELSGALTAGFFAVDKSNNNGAQDTFKITAVDITLTDKVNDTIGFVADLGKTEQDTLLTADITQNNQNFGVDFAYVSIRPLDNLTIDAGVITTNIGYELYHTYENSNIFFGMVWNAQPVTYAGARITFEAAENLSLYFEYNQDSGSYGTINYTEAFATGIIGNIFGLDYAISYYDYAGFKNLVDFVLSGSFGNIDFAINFDYQWMDDKTKNSIKNQGAVSVDDHAYGVALYLTPHLTEQISVPIRLEYVNDGQSKDNAGNEVDTGLYGIPGDFAYSITITPTYQPTKNSYIRAELGYVKTDQLNNDFQNNAGKSYDHRYVYAIEAGYMF